jgi:hypothetical protein
MLWACLQRVGKGLERRTDKRIARRFITGSYVRFESETEAFGS